MQWSPQQKTALQSIKNWYRTRDSSVFRLFGYAGTGKTTLAKHIGDEVVGDGVLYASYTGKAALAMRERGCEKATTIHSLIYTAREKSHERLRELENELGERCNAIAKMAGTDFEKARSKDTEVIRLEEEIKLERRKIAQPSFKLNPESPLVEASLVIIDECSMVDARMGEDLLSFDVPILVLGDPAQLPPVGSTGFFTRQRPNFLLDEIHRQAGDNPIINLATLTRNQEPIRLGSYGDSMVIRKEDIDAELAQSCDQILVGRNKTRHSINRRIRDLKGFTTGVTKGDRVVCLRNDHDLGLLNGSLWDVVETFPGMTDRIFMTLEGMDGEVNVESHLQHFERRSDDLPLYERMDAQEFDYAYAITVHKAQGSQWKSVLVFDESFCFRQDKYKWLYTALTRAQDRVILVRD